MKAPSFLSIPSCARLLLAFSAGYIFVASLITAIVYYPIGGIHSLYFLAVMLLVAATSVASLKNRSFSLPPLNHLQWRKHGIYLAIIAITAAIIWFLLRKPILFAHSVWFDEASQFLWITDNDIAIFAAVQQQPPMDYFLSKFAKAVLGVNEFSLLFHAVSFGILSFAAFALWLAQIRFPAALLPIPLILFASQHTLYQYSSEARPISIAVFFGLLTTIFAYDGQKRGRAHALPLFSSATLLLFSTGLQPMFFLVLLAACFFPLYTSKKGNRGLVKFLSYFVLLPLLVFLPNLILIYIQSARWNQFHSGSYFSFWLKAATSLQMQDLEIYWRSFTQATWVLAIAPATLILALSLRRRRPAWAKRTIKISLGATAFIILFPLCFQIFWSIINWNNSPHYFVLWVVGALALSSLCLAQLFRFPSAKPRVFAFAVACSLCLFLSRSLLMDFVTQHRHLTRSTRGIRPDWRSLSRLAQERRMTLFVSVPYAPHSEMGFGLFDTYSAVIYDNSSMFTPLLSRHSEKEKYSIHFPSYRISRTIRNFDKKSDILFLIKLPIEKERSAYQSLEDFFSIAGYEPINGIRGYIVLRQIDQEFPIESIKRAYEKIIEYDPRSPKNYYALDALISEALLEGRVKKANRLLDHLKSILVPEQQANPDLQAYLKKLKKEINHIQSMQVASRQ